MSPRRPACRRRPSRSRSTSPTGWRRRRPCRIRAVAETLGYRPHPSARMLTQGRTRIDRRADPAGAVGHLREPVLRARSARGSPARPRRPATPCTSSRRSTARWPGRSNRATVDGVVADRPVGGPPGGRADPARRPADGARGLDRPARASRRSRSTTRAAPGRPPITSSASATATSSCSAIEPPARSDIDRPDGVMGRRLRGYRDGPRGGRHRPARRRSCVARPRIDGGAGRRSPGLGRRPAADRRPGHERRDRRRRDARGPRARPARPGRPQRRRASTTSTSPASSDPALTTIHQPIARKGEQAVGSCSRSWTAGTARPARDPGDPARRARVHRTRARRGSPHRTRRWLGPIEVGRGDAPRHEHREDRRRHGIRRRIRRHVEISHGGGTPQHDHSSTLRRTAGDRRARRDCLQQRRQPDRRPRPRRGVRSGQRLRPGGIRRPRRRLRRRP